MDPTRRLFDRLVGWAPVLLLGGLAALTYWLDAQVQPPAERRDGSSRHDPDVFLENFRAITFDAAGKPRETLAARRAEHFPDDDSAEVIAPDLTLTEPGRPTVTVQSQRARIAGDRENGWFEGNVRVHRDAEPPAGGDSRPTGPVSLTTEKLHVVPKQYRVDTDAPVTIEEPRGIIRGRGMTLDNKTKTFHLRSQVSGTLQPNATETK
jgi:lipopolysaccharide export system protein LptC